MNETDLQIVLSGVVQLGDQRGRLLGFPTANIAVPSSMAASIADGVYAGWVRRSASAAHPAAISIGRRPTFYAASGARLVEAHLIDFDDDLYGRTIDVMLTHRVREQLRFSSGEQLAEQLSMDIRRCRELVAPGQSAEMPG